MPNELPPSVVQILRSEHAPDRDSVERLPPADSARLAAIARGETHPSMRVKALSCFAGTEEGAELFRAALRDRDADDTVRATGATLLSRTGAAAEAVLLDALPEERSAVVRHKITAGLARIGSERAISALTAQLEGAADDLRAHIEFARSVVAYRLGRTGYELPAVEDADVLPAPAPAQPGEAGRAEPAPVGTAPAVVADVASDSYGVALDSSAIATVVCGERHFALIVNPEAFEGELMLERPVIAGLVAGRAPVDGSYHTSMVVLCHPEGEARYRIAVHRLNGRAMYTGSAVRSGYGVEFELAAVRGPGAVETTITGACGREGFTEFTFTTGRSLPANVPVAVDE